MKQFRVLTAVAVVALSAALTAQSTLSPEALLKAAINREIVDGDTAGAMQQYQEIATTYSSNHAVAAGALLRLGGLYEKQGKADARPTYEQIVVKYPDTGTTFTAARARLAALQQSSFPFTTRDVSSSCGPDVFLADWSPDGKYVAYVKRNVEVGGVCNAATGKPVNLGLRPTEEMKGFGWAPNSQSVAIAVSTSPDQLEVRTVSLPRGETQVIASSPARFGSALAWSPDSRKLAFLSVSSKTDAPGPEVHVVTLLPKTSAPVNLGPLTTTSPSALVWAPDGSRLAFVAPDAAGTTPIRIVDVNTQQARTIQVPPARPNSQVTLEDWTPTNQIFFKQSVTGGSDSYLVDALGGTPRKICEGRRDGDGCQGLSPDSTLQVRRENVNGGGRIVLRNTATGQDRPLTNEQVTEQTISYNGPSGTSGSFSPDGKLFAFHSNRDGKNGMYVVPVDQTPVANPLKIANLSDGGLTKGRWTGSHVVYSFSDPAMNIFRMDLDLQTGQPSGPIVRLTQDTALNIQPCISPDGRRIAYISRWGDGGGRRGFYLMDANGQRERLMHEVAADRLTRMTLVGWRSNDELLVSDLGDGPLARGGGNPTTLMVLNLTTNELRPAGTSQPDPPARVFDKAPVLKNPPRGVDFAWKTARKSPDGSFVVVEGSALQVTWQRIENITYDAVVKHTAGKK